MDIVTAILIMLLWYIYMYLEGLREAWYWHQKMESNDEFHPVKDEHPYFLFQRMCMGLAAACTTIYIAPILNAVAMAVSMVLVAAFIHNGSMYSERERLKPGIYPAGWLSQSTRTGGATPFLTPVVRIVLFIAGVILFITSLWNI